MVFQNDILAGASGTAAGYTIDQSIRFNDDDSAYLNDTQPTVDGSSFTFSFWVKRGNLGTEQWIINGSPTGSLGYPDYIRWESTDKIRYRIFSKGKDATTTAVFRDVGAWYHIVANYNGSTGATKLWVNNVQHVDIAAGGSTGSTYYNDTGQILDIGRSGSGGNYMDGYLAEIVKLDNTVADPTSFGEYNDDGVWVPIDVSGLTFGSGGFYLKGQDSAALGDDSSGNGNDFTSSGLTTSSQVTDTPTDNYCVLNDLVQNRAGGLTNSDGIRAANLQLYRPSASANSFGSGTMAVYGGVGSPKLYYEVYTSTYPGGNVLQMYIEEATDSSNSQPANSFGLNQRHTTSAYRLFIYPGGSETPASWTSEFGQGVYVGLAVDFANDEISANVDGTEIFSYDAAELAVLSGITTDTFAGRWWRPKIQVANDAATIIDVNFGQNAFQNAPAGYVGWSTSAIPTPTVKDGSAYFNTILYTGNGSASTRSFTGVGFQPDFVWKKIRSGADNHWLHDAVRGADKGLNSNRTDSEYTSTRLTSFDSDGFSFATNDPDTNGSGSTYVAWNWLAANGTASNTDGSITSTVSVNQTAGFSVIGYTGNATSGATIGHGLGVAPAVVITKSRDNGTGRNWAVYHEALGPTKYLELDNNNQANVSSTRWNDTAPSSTVITLGSQQTTNDSGAAMIAYAFAEVEGFSKFGSYTGNGSTDGPFVYCGFRPAFVLVKEHTSADDWLIYDSIRDPYNVAGRVLRPDDSAAEFDGRGGSRDVDFLSNGFKFRSSNGTMNGSGVGYIFMAFAEHPFGGDGVAPVPAR